MKPRRAAMRRCDTHSMSSRLLSRSCFRHWTGMSRPCLAVVIVKFAYHKCTKGTIPLPKPAMCKKPWPRQGSACGHDRILHTNRGVSPVADLIIYRSNYPSYCSALQVNQTEVGLEKFPRKTTRPPATSTPSPPVDENQATGVRINKC